MEQRYYKIVSLNPNPDGTDDERLVEGFENKDDAEFVLSALEKVNVLFHCYQIKEEILVKPDYLLTKSQVTRITRFIYDSGCGVHCLNEKEHCELECSNKDSQFSPSEIFIKKINELLEDK